MIFWNHKNGAIQFFFSPFTTLIKNDTDAFYEHYPEKKKKEKRKENKKKEKRKNVRP